VYTTTRKLDDVLPPWQYPLLVFFAQFPLFKIVARLGDNGERINDQYPALILGDEDCVLFMYICATGLRLIKGKLSGVES